MGKTLRIFRFYLIRLVVFKSFYSLKLVLPLFNQYNSIRKPTTFKKIKLTVYLIMPAVIGCILITFLTFLSLETNLAIIGSGMTLKVAGKVKRAIITL